MAKALTLRLDDGREFSCDLGSKVEKKDLYGQAKRIAERDGKALARGWLAGDGRLFGGGALSLAKVDAEGTPCEDAAPYMDGEPAPSVPGSFEAGMALEPVPLATLAEFCVRDVYPLGGAEDLAPGLYRTWFNYRKSHQANEALVLVRDSKGGSVHPLFLLVGQSRLGAWLGQSIPYEFFDAEAEAEDEADEMDFGSML